MSFRLFYWPTFKLLRDERVNLSIKRTQQKLDESAMGKNKNKGGGGGNRGGAHQSGGRGGGVQGGGGGRNAGIKTLLRS